MFKLILSISKLTFIAICFALVLQADVCREPKRLVKQAPELNTIPSQLAFLYPGLVDGDTDALSLFTKYAIDLEDPFWLELAGEFGSSGALYYSAMHSDDPKAIMRWLKRSAELGHPKGQFEYALLQTDIDAKMRWMEASAIADYQPAIIAMAKYSFESPKHLTDGNINSVEKQAATRMWLEKAAKFDATSAYKLANLYWGDGLIEESKSLLDNAAEQGYAPAKSLLHVLNNNDSHELKELLNVPPEGPHCAQSIQFVATNLRSFAQAIAFKNNFDDDARLSTLPLCVMKPIWLKKGQINCDANYQGQARLGCNISRISAWKTPLNFTHLVIFAEQGKANVNNGIMFLDQSDTYSVFVHELAHFAGFVDEYALPTDLANYHCSKNTAPNLLLKDESAETDESSINYLPESRALMWKTALDAHNTLQKLESRQPVLHRIAKSATCKNLGISSFKPTQQMTFLEYHDVRNIPRVYRTLWRQRLLDTANYSAISDNLAIDAFSRDDDEAGLFWSEQ
ncbi:sel1 repeat family protein [Glaciecola sp. MH2013]|uniref:tetratricopeptide repeat protein n=1 Tax=Glaciecola sp. MH2013 TaxID=2785524 RepID=UPI00189C5B5A|nr:tetratricopeptide repeat protein [Glaciecola sp. MH2013]MBF7072649.1 sel1 repeat family protein [Glaciecola sp. MH2013]